MFDCNCVVEAGSNIMRSAVELTVSVMRSIIIFIVNMDQIDQTNCFLVLLLPSAPLPEPDPWSGRLLSLSKNVDRQLVEDVAC